MVSCLRVQRSVPALRRATVVCAKNRAQKQQGKECRSRERSLKSLDLAIALQPPVRVKCQWQLGRVSHVLLLCAVDCRQKSVYC